MGIINTIIEFDKSLFSFLNGIHSPLWDNIMTILSGKFTFIPLYLLFIYYILKKSSKKWIVLIGILLSVAINDICASQIAKPTIQRLRPCHDTTLSSVHTVDNHCGKQYGFFSSHAANTFGIAFFMAAAFFRKNNTALVLLVSWGTIVSYSRIYLGVHFPLDIISGCLCGLVVSSTIVYLLKRCFKAI